MKSLLALSILIISSQSFAYGTRISTGTGINCSLNIIAKPLVEHGCISHRVSEVKDPNGSGTNVEGQKYQTVRQTYDGAQCFTTNVIYNYESVTGDLSQGLTAELGGTTIAATYLDSSSLYIYEGGAIDTEMRRGIITYVYKEADEKAATKDKELVWQLKDLNIQAITISYNDQAKTLDAELVTRDGTRHFSSHADFAKGVKRSSVSFTFPIGTYELNAAKRNYSADFFCGPISQTKI